MALELNTERLLGEGKVAPSGPITYEEFLEWADEKTFAEWVGGEILIMSPAGFSHQDISGFLFSILRFYTEEYGIGKTLAAPFQMWLPNVQRGREPDILFLTKANMANFQANRLNGPADLVIEIVSPESLVRDRSEKYAEYEIEGVREYWIIDPMIQRVDFFVLGPEGRYERIPPDATGKYECAVVPGFWFNENWLWQEPLPTMGHVMREWAQASRLDE